MTAADVPPPAGEPPESPFVGAPLTYAPAIIAGMAMGTVALWIVAALRTAGGPDRFIAHLVPWAHPMAQSDERDQFLYHAGIALTALGGIAGAWTYTRLTRAQPTAGAPQLPKQAPADGTTRRQLPKAASDDGPVVATRPRPAHSPPRWVAVLLHTLVVGAVVCLLYVPDYRSLAGSFLNAENFHHWHFFAMMPTHAYLTGAVPVLESYSQYGVGLPVIVGSLCRLLGGFSHANVVWIGMTYGVVYFVALYALLWLWLRDWLWSIGGLGLAVLLQQFCGLDPSSVLWQYPSSTILRSPLDVWVFLLLTGHVLSSRWAYVCGAGLVVSAALYWESDTGVYLAGAYAVYCGYCWIDDLTAHGWDWMAACKYLATLAMVPVVFLVFTGLTVGGAIVTTVFWERFLEPLRLFRAGFGMLPMPAPQWGNLYLFLTPGLYVFAAVLALVAAVRRSVQKWRGGYLLGTLGVYGLGVYHQYVGRSHPWNWFHVSIPVVVVAIMLTRVVLQRLETRTHDDAPRIARAAQLVPVVLLGTAGDLGGRTDRAELSWRPLRQVVHCGRRLGLCGSWLPYARLGGGARFARSRCGTASTNGACKRAGGDPVGV